MTNQTRSHFPESFSTLNSRCLYRKRKLANQVVCPCCTIRIQQKTENCSQWFLLLSKAGTTPERLALGAGWAWSWEVFGDGRMEKNREEGEGLNRGGKNCVQGGPLLHKKEAPCFIWYLPDRIDKKSQLFHMARGRFCQVCAAHVPGICRMEVAEHLDGELWGKTSENNLKPIWLICHAGRQGQSRGAQGPLLCLPHNGCPGRTRSLRGKRIWVGNQDTQKATIQAERCI